MWKSNGHEIETKKPELRTRQQALSQAQASLFFSALVERKYLMPFFRVGQEIVRCLMDEGQDAVAGLAGVGVMTGKPFSHFNKPCASPLY